MLDPTCGAVRLLSRAADHGVSICFANPGTTELALTAAFDAETRIRPILCGFEGVCSGAADGYGRMLDRPALTLTHLGPGFANALANLHNARRADSPVINLIGDHTSTHLKYDTPLTSDIAALAHTVSRYVGTVAHADDAVPQFDAAIGATRYAQSRVATLIFPADFQQHSAAVPAPFAAASPPARSEVYLDHLERAAAALRDGTRALLLLHPRAACAAGTRLAGEIAQATGCEVAYGATPARCERGRSHYAIARVPYFPEPARAYLDGFRHVILVGARPPVTYFGYEGQDSELVAAERLQPFAAVDDDLLAALRALHAEIGAVNGAAVPMAPAAPAPTGMAARVCERVAALLPEDAIVTIEGSTFGGPFQAHSAAAAPHSELALPGGAIGMGLPCALGAAVACPDRKVVALQSDGSAMYTLQALWTMAREQADVVVIIAANRRYQILQTEMARIGDLSAMPVSAAMTQLQAPHLDWCGIARASGVAAYRVDAAEAFDQAFKACLATRGPTLIEVLC